MPEGREHQNRPPEGKEGKTVGNATCKNTPTTHPPHPANVVGNTLESEDNNIAATVTAAVNEPPPPGQTADHIQQHSYTTPFTDTPPPVGGGTWSASPRRVPSY